MVTVKKHFLVDDKIIDPKSFVEYVLGINEPKVINIHEG